MNTDKAELLFAADFSDSRDALRPGSLGGAGGAGMEGIQSIYRG
jgi:hypothetical protein